jgi:hypothetical protein
MSGYKIIDVDTHVTEMPDVWTSQVPAHMRDAVPVSILTHVETCGGIWYKRLRPDSPLLPAWGSKKSSQELRGNAPRGV